MPGSDAGPLDRARSAIGEARLACAAVRALDGGRADAARRWLITRRSAGRRGVERDAQVRDHVLDLLALETCWPPYITYGTLARQLASRPCLRFERYTAAMSPARPSRGAGDLAGEARSSSAVAATAWVIGSPRSCCDHSCLPWRRLLAITPARGSFVER
jgi:hypothetical protein